MKNRDETEHEGNLFTITGNIKEIGKNGLLSYGEYKLFGVKSRTT